MNQNVSIDHGRTGQNLCLSGTVQFMPNPPGFVGVDQGFLTLSNGTVIRITEPVVAGNAGISIQQADGRQVRVCGHLLFENGQLTMTVTSIFPLVFGQ